MLTNDDLGKIEKLLRPLMKEISDVSRRQRKMERDLKLIVNYFDDEYLDHEKRIERVENHLNLPKISAN